MTTVRELNWFWIALMAFIPPLVSFPIAYAFWRKAQPIFGNLAGTGFIFAAAFFSIFREHAAIDRVVRQCLEDGVPCWPEPSAFTRFAIYAFIGLFQVIVLFLVSLRVEEKLRRRDYAPEWR